MERRGNWAGNWTRSISWKSAKSGSIQQRGNSVRFRCWSSVGDQILSTSGSFSGRGWSRSGSGGKSRSFSGH